MTTRMIRRARHHSGLPLLAMLLLGSCVAPPRVVRTAPPAPPPAVVTPPPPAAHDWTDGPLTPGGWSYGPGEGGTRAAFGVAGAPPLFTLRCDLASRRIILARAGAAATIVVTTTSVARAFAISGGAAASLPAGDPFLDAMAFSRGRLLVRGDALPALVLPAFAEIGRVVEDCRG